MCPVIIHFWPTYFNAVFKVLHASLFCPTESYPYYVQVIIFCRKGINHKNTVLKTVNTVLYFSLSEVSLYLKYLRGLLN